MHVAKGQIILRLGAALLGRFTNPRHRRHLILPYSLALGVAAPQVELGSSQILLSGMAKPFHRLYVIRRQAELARVKCQTQVKLGLGIALFCLGAEDSELLSDRVALLGMGARENQTGGPEQCRHKGGCHGNSEGLHLALFLSLALMLARSSLVRLKPAKNCSGDISFATSRFWLSSAMPDVLAARPNHAYASS